MANRVQQVGELPGHSQMSILINGSLLAAVGDIALDLEFPVCRDQKVPHLLSGKGMNARLRLLEGLGQNAAAATDCQDRPGGAKILKKFATVLTGFTGICPTE